MTKLKKYTNQEYEKLCETMEKRFALQKLLRDFYRKHNYVPFEYKQTWENFIAKDGGQLWNENKIVLKKLRKAAKVIAIKRIKEEKEHNA